MIRHTTPSRGKIEINVEASGLVNVYVVKAEKLRHYRNESMFAFRSVTELSKRLELPLSPGDIWYLVIRNRSEKALAVHYEVFY